MTHYTSPTSVAIDPTNGDVVAAGYFYGTVDFGGGVLSSDPPPAGETEGFVARFDKNGSNIWAKALGTGVPAKAGVTAAVVDGSGNVFIGGGVSSGAIDFGCGALAGIGKVDVFVVKLDQAGACTWSKRLGAVDQSQNLNSIGVDGSGNVVIGGVAYGGVDFGGGPKTGYYIVKFDGAGTHAWSKAFAASSSASSPQSVVDPPGSVTIAGSFDSTVNFGGGTLTPVGGVDAFVARFDASGGYLWAKQYGDNQNQAVLSVANDSTGNIFVAGDLVGTIDLGSGPMSYTAGETTTFLAKIDPSGNGIWSKQFATSSGGGTLTPNAMAVDGQGGVTLGIALRGNDCCFTAGSADFGGGTLFSQGNNDSSVVLASYDSTGQYRWAFSGGPPSVNHYSSAGAYHGVAAWGDRIVVAGQFGWDPNSTTSPPGTTLALPGGTLAAIGGIDMFLASFAP